MPNRDTNLFLSAVQAARILGVTEEDLAVYENGGHLTPISRGGERFYYRSEVIRLMEQRDSDRLPTVSQETMMKIFAELSELRAGVELVFRMIGIGEEPIPLDGPRVALLYEKVMSALSQDAYTLAELEDWSSMLLRLRDGHLAAMVTHSLNDRPWVVVYRLVERLCMWLCEDPAVNQSPRLRTILFQLEAAREHVRSMWVTLNTLDPGRDYRTKLSRIIPDVDEILEEVARGKGLSSVPPLLDTILKSS